MKRFLRIFVIEAITLYVASQLTTGLIFQNGTPSLLLTAVALAVASLFVKPIINLLLLPLNLLTFGFFRFLTNAITLFLVDLVLNEFMITEFLFKGYRGSLIVIPSLKLASGPLSYLAFSLLISIVTTFIYWLLV